jgi:hypothetical protein
MVYEICKQLNCILPDAINRDNGMVISLRHFMLDQCSPRYAGFNIDSNEN